MKHTHIMIDLETASTEHNSLIVQIAAVVFDKDGIIGTFNEFPSFKSGEELGFHVSRETMNFWDSQDSVLRELVFGGTTGIAQVLEEFSQFIAQIKALASTYDNSILVYSKGASFDLELLTDAYRICDLPLPWTFREERCFRTVYNMFSSFTTRVLKPESGVPHNALYDAEYQASQLRAILTGLAENGIDLW